MRISDWSSDVCSSDLGFLFMLRTSRQVSAILPRRHGFHTLTCGLREKRPSRLRSLTDSRARKGGGRTQLSPGRSAIAANMSRNSASDGAWLDRKRAVYGQSVSVRVYLGGRRLIKTKKKIKKTRH